MTGHVANSSPDEGTESRQALEQALSIYAAAYQCVDVSEISAQLESAARDLEDRASHCEEFVSSLDTRRSDAGTEEGDASGEAEKELQRLEADLESSIQTLQHELAFEELQHEELEAKRAASEQLDAKLWTALNNNTERRHQRQEQLASLEQRTKLASQNRAMLKKTNVLNDAFSIWYDGKFGTICGLRLGKLPEDPVEWSEINAAWGQVALLLATLAREVHFSFSKYRIIPQGSTSKVAMIGREKTSYELFCNGGFFKGSFNNAMICILHCVYELGEYAEKVDRTMQLPFPILGDKVGGLSIRTGGQDSVWTNALKYLLADLKWLVAWSTKPKPSGPWSQ
mmetsp:Transcript_17607/g.31041  ORF Transcript_17607/g.31041 Transcript_17607/m.31041 type:complete len:341 (+) Transcript_17607:31-1053(+)